ncbi:MarR family winged helix-turn-helix transcriptional regulator [Kribbella sp. NPDC051587]|uniref:MarR family winged helix-turn-helix transcriptional regulator n=1 Tax=Kribbella sp. NPDC051587 TaxID=3364119 RepID=UPI003795D6BC
MASTRTVPDLTSYLKRAGHVLETQLHAALGEIGLTTRMQCVLSHALEGERTQIQLAELAYLDKTTMVVTVDALEQAGYAERKASATDRRTRIIAVTEAGAKIAHESQAIVDRVHRETLAALTAEERAPFVAALETLLNDRLATPVDAQPVRRARERTN